MQGREKSIIKRILINEERRQRETICLIASENFISKDVKDALSSVFINKYAEGVSHRRHYPGCQFADELEDTGERLARKVFGVEGANLQPYSGSIANLIAFRALLKKGDRILAMHPFDGGHSTHATPQHISGEIYRTYYYRVNKDGLLDYEDIRKIAKKIHPTLIITGSSYYPREIDYKAFGDIVREIGALLLADIAHPAGLIAAGLHNSPAKYADVITSTTHKTLRGPRGGIIMFKNRFREAINKALYPGVQGGPLLNLVAAKAIALSEATTPEFVKYQKKVVENTTILCNLLIEYGFEIYTNGSSNHLIVIDLKRVGIDSSKIERELEKIGITSNALPVPGRDGKTNDGLRIGTAAITTLNYSPKDIEDIATILYSLIFKRDIDTAIRLKNKIIRRTSR